jgi:hypothetical protein
MYGRLSRVNARFIAPNGGNTGIYRDTLNVHYARFNARRIARSTRW